MKIQNAYGIVLKNGRANQGLSQAELARLTDLDRTFISLLERGERQPTLTTIFQISKALKVAPSDLVRQVERVLKRGARKSNPRPVSSRL